MCAAKVEENDPDYVVNNYVKKGVSEYLLTWVILGGTAFMAHKPSSVYDFISASNKGISRQSIINLADIMSVPMKDMAELLNISYKTFSRKNDNEVFDVVVSSLSIEIATTVSRGLSVFEDAGKFNRWLHKENRALGDKKPFELLNIPTGIKMVNKVLNRIEEGVYT
jgi:putative toxin-antitoxin system antitoxin component (TIGR02293 family)